MTGYVMKFHWFDPWIDYSSEDRDFGRANMGLQRFRSRPPHPDELPGAENDEQLPVLPEATAGNGFIEVVVPLEATTAEAAKKEALRHYRTRPYGDEPRGFMVVDALSNETVHWQIAGGEPDSYGDPEGKPSPVAGHSTSGAHSRGRRGPA
jgi:hypothetical protein